MPITFINNQYRTCY